jgi:hypothetical protein
VPFLAKIRDGAKYEVLLVLMIQITVSAAVMMCSLVPRTRNFGGKVKKPSNIYHEAQGRYFPSNRAI